MILSASRRTDIPGFYSDWFLNRLKEGYVLTRNPLNHNQVSKIILSPDAIDCIVFWTKDPENMVDRLDDLDALGYPYYFQFTITPYGCLPRKQAVKPGSSNKNKWELLFEEGKRLEPNLREKDKIIDTFRRLSDRLTNARVLWRYDPILITDTLSAEYHMEMFAYLCSELKGYTTLCTISFVDFYSKISRRMKSLAVREISEAQMHELAAALAKIAHSYRIEVRACCEAVDLQPDGVKPAACIDRELVERICGHAIPGKKDRNQRLGCGCVQSIDVGVYNTCKNGCLYCYANHSEKSVENNILSHHPNSNILIGRVEEHEKVTKRNEI